MSTGTSRASRRAVVGAIGLSLAITPATMSTAHAQLSLHPGLSGMREFTTSGTWRAPGLLANDRVTHVLVLLQGAGGGGSGFFGSGAGAGGCVLSTVAVIPGRTYAIEVGAPGAASNDDTAGMTGGRTAFRLQGGSVLAVANGGSGGAPRSQPDEGAAGGSGVAHADGGIVYAGSRGRYERVIIGPVAGRIADLCALYAPDNVGNGGAAERSGQPGWALILW